MKNYTCCFPFLELAVISRWLWRWEYFCWSSWCKYLLTDIAPSPRETSWLLCFISYFFFFLSELITNLIIYIIYWSYSIISYHHRPHYSKYLYNSYKIIYKSKPIFDSHLEYSFWFSTTYIINGIFRWQGDFRLHSKKLTLLFTVSLPSDVLSFEFSGKHRNEYFYHVSSLPFNLTQLMIKLHYNNKQSRQGKLFEAPGFEKIW